MSKSENLYSAARELIPGGVNSPVRAFTGVGGTPLFIEKADGAYLYDVDGKAYIDYVGSWGPMVLGHNHPAIRNAVIEAAERGLSFGAPTEMEVKMAQLVTELVPTMDMVRMVNSGDPKELSDMGLRYDLTLPLSRFYAANKDKLPHPFKVIQTDRVFRAERPQKGRLREFVQCDIDILGDESPNAEVELIDVTPYVEPAPADSTATAEKPEAAPAK